MSSLAVFEQENQRVLTTQQLAESYGTDVRTISNNYTRNKDRYTERKHFYYLEGEELQTFKGIHQINESLKYVSKLYLWTEKGAWLHAKSLGTDEAWEAYENLVDEYYRIKEQKPQSIEDLIIMQAQSVKELKSKVDLMEVQAIETKEQVNTIKETIITTDKDWRKWINKQLTRIGTHLRDYQGIKQESYKLLETRGVCLLERRLTNLKARLLESGATKTQINNANYLDVIEAEPRLKEIYTNIVKELSIKYIA